MTSAQIQKLLQPPDRSLSVQRAVSVIDSHFTTLDQVKSSGKLSELLSQSSTTSSALKERLESSKANVDAVIKDTRKATQEQLVSAQELALMRHSLADELTSLSEELVSTTTGGPSQPSLLEEIEALHRSLKELEGVKAYVRVLHQAIWLSERAVKRVENMSSSTPVTEGLLTDYSNLHKLVQSVKNACCKAEAGTGQTIKLVALLEQLLDASWAKIKDRFSSTLLNAAEKLQWPLPVDYPAAKLEDRKDFESAFLNLLKLQELGEKLRPTKSEKCEDDNTKSKGGLYPLQALIRPIALRFKYHFEGTRQTNRLDKPEWYFAHISDVSYQHQRIMEVVCQQLVQKSKYSSLNVWREFARLLLPILARKIRRSMPSLLPHPPLLAHTVYQALAFDDALRDAGFSLEGTLASSEPGSEDWQGTSDIILGSKEWFDAWLEGERKFAEDQYNDIISAPDAWHLSEGLDDDVVNERDVRSTNSARRVKALIEQITDRYKPLPRFIHKTRFLIAVQVPILELYHTRISESLDAFETLSSFLVRAVPGALAGQTGTGRDPKNMTSGVEGSQRLVKAYVSAKWMGSIMAAWGEDLFFLELWHQICEKASLRSRVEGVDGLPDPNGSKDEGTIFDELVSQYNKLADRAESMLARQVCGEVEAELKAHLYRQSNAGDEAVDDVAISQTLLPPIAKLSSQLSFLRKVLPPNVVVHIYRKIAVHVSNHILQRQVLYRGRGRLTAGEGRVILNEANLWIEACRIACGSSVRSIERPWQKLLGAGLLLSLDEESLQRLVSSVRLGKTEQYEKFVEQIGVNNMTSDEVMDVLMVREEYS